MAAVQLLLKVAVIKCKPHTRAYDSISLGNALADGYAKDVIHSYEPTTALPTFLLTDLQVDLDILSALQASSPHTSFWNTKGAVCGADGIWKLKYRLVAPPTLFPSLFALSHGPCHVSTGGMCRVVARDWWAPGFSAYAAKGY